MIRPIVLSLLAAFAFAGAAQAQVHLYENESAERKAEFLRNLRRKGYIDLAKEFNDQLIKNAKPEDLPTFKLEEARTTVDMAKNTAPSDRLKMIAEARNAFEPFIKANPNSAAGVQARIEMAKLTALLAVMKLNKAYAEKGEEEREAGAKAARDLYDAADAEYAAIISGLEAAKQEKDAVQAEFDRALNLLDKAAAYVNTENSAQNRKRAETVEEARKIFTKFSNDTSSAIGLMANAYLVKCYQEGQDPSKIAEHLAIVRDARGPSAIPAQKQANYYDILYIKTMPGYKGDRLKGVAEQVDLWIKAYPFAKKTIEGEQLRFEQADAYLNIGAGMTEGYKKEKWAKMTEKEKAPVIALLANADKALKSLEDDRGDYGERSAGLRGAIKITKIDLEIYDSIPKGKSDNFESALAKAEREFQKASRLDKAADKIKLFTDGQALLSKAIALGEKENITPSKMHDAQFLLASAYNAINDRQRAAITFEMLGRANPPSKKSAEAASYAINFYKKFIDEDRDESARYFMRELADFILGPEREQLWKDDPVIGIARYQIAMDYYAEKDFKLASEHISKLPREFPGYTQAQADAVFIALSAREADQTPEGKKEWTAKARDALGRMGPLPAGADGTTTLRWFIASAKEPEILYSEATQLLRDGKEKEAGERYQQMAKSIANLQETFKKEGDKLNDERKKSMGFHIEVLHKYVHLGSADVEYRKGNYKRVLDNDMLGGLTRDMVQIWSKDKKADIVVPDVRVIADSLSLVLRSFVQLEQIDAAKGMYEMLMKLKPASGEAQDNANFTRALIQDLAHQVEQLKQSNDNKKLQAMVGKFTPFGDSLAKTLVYDKKNPDMRDVKNMVRFFTSLEQYKKAADLIKTIPEPKTLKQKAGDKLKDEQERELYIYWDFQLEQANLLRLEGNQLRLSWLSSKDKKDEERMTKAYEAANKAYVAIINHENSRMATMAKMDQIRLYEDQEKYGLATKLWGDFMKDLQRAGIGQNKKLQELYFDAYYNNSLCFYKLSQKPDTIKAGKSELYLKTAASMIYRLESSKDALGWTIVGPRYQEYMNKEKTLKAAYETAKKAAK